jgi:hypothetical protein
MAALTAERSVSRKGAESTATVPVITVLVKASTTIFKGALVCIDSTGFAIPAANTPATLIAIGVATKTVTAAASGTFPLDVQRGLFPFNNTGGDLVVQADMGKKVYITDDNTVAHTAGTLPTAGVFMGFDEAGLPLVQIGNLSSTGV